MIICISFSVSCHKKKKEEWEKADIPTYSSNNSIILR